MLSFQHQQKGVSPRMLKALVSRGHPEFSSNRQQDAHEFLQHMVNLVEVSGASVHVRHIRNVHRLVWRGHVMYVNKARVELLEAVEFKKRPST